MGAVKAKPRYSGATAGAAVLLDLSQRGRGGWGGHCIRARVVTSQWGFGTNSNRREAAGAAQSNALSAARGRAGMSGFCHAAVTQPSPTLAATWTAAILIRSCQVGAGLQRGGVSSESLLHNLTPDIISRMNISLANNE